MIRTVIYALTFVLSASAQDIVEIPIQLPEPFFGGTPLDYFGPNLEAPNFKDPAIIAPKETENVALNKPVTSSKEPSSGSLSQITDGVKSYKEEAVVAIGPGQQWIQIDLENVYSIYGIMLWHAYTSERVYFDVIIQICESPEFKEEVITIYNNDHDNSSGMGKGKDKEYVDSYRGRLFALPDGVKGRYVRFYSNEGTAGEDNHYTEVEVYGVEKPSDATDEIKIELPKPFFGGRPL